MMDCTDRHDRYFLRLISKNVMLYSEMVATKSAIYGDRKRIIVISPNGDSSLYNRSLFSSFNNDNGIVPGSIIYIPREIGKLEGINYAAVVAPIFSSLALSLASLNSINN